MNLEPEPDFIYDPEPEPDNTNITDPSYCYNRDPIKPLSENDIEKSGIRAIYTDDPKSNYLFGSNGVEKDLDSTNNEIVMVGDERINYAIKQVDDLDKEEDLPVEVDKRDSLSYMNVKTIDEGVEWYKQNFPKVPEDLYPIMARWNWGDLSNLTKKDVKNDKKRVAKGKKPKNCGFKMEKGNFVVKFD